MAVWLVSAVWQEDEVEARDLWEVNAANAHEAVMQATNNASTQPVHVEARRLPGHGPLARAELRPGEARRIPVPSLPVVGFR